MMWEPDSQSRMSETERLIERRLRNLKRAERAMWIFCAVALLTCAGAAVYAFVQAL